MASASNWTAGKRKAKLFPVKVEALVERVEDKFKLWLTRDDEDLPGELLVRMSREEAEQLSNRLLGLLTLRSYRDPNCHARHFHGVFCPTCS